MLEDELKKIRHHLGHKQAARKNSLDGPGKGVQLTKISNETE